jgi:hypothetical protein
MRAAVYYWRASRSQFRRQVPPWPWSAGCSARRPWVRWPARGAPAPPTRYLLAGAVVLLVAGYALTSVPAAIAARTGPATLLRAE